jgi:hypothetical protein
MSMQFHSRGISGGHLEELGADGSIISLESAISGYWSDFAAQNDPIECFL